MSHQPQVNYETNIDYTLFNSDRSLINATTDRIPGTSQAFNDSQIPYGLSVKPYGDLPNVSPPY